jgi:hypothetical protein
MRNRLTVFTILLPITFCLTESVAQPQTRNGLSQKIDRSAGITGGFRFDMLAQARPGRRAGFALMPMSRVVNASSSITPMGLGPNLPVMGGGTLGRLTKWTGFTSSNSFIGNSTIFEDKFGAVGIGTDTPTSRLTVAGVIETIIGGFKFPDGTLQTTSASGALLGVAHDTTLVGDGTGGSPLGVAVPLILSGSVEQGNIVEVTNTATFGVGMVVNGGASGIGLRAIAGDSVEGGGNTGLTAFGGNSGTGSGGEGVVGLGGDSFGGGKSAGTGINAVGGEGFDGALNGLAGEFSGNVEVRGDVEVTQDLNVSGTKNFKIDHPLDPENKYLYHAAIESSEVLNVYSGNVTTNNNGEAIVGLPDWFEAMNRDLRYQLTVIGTLAHAIVASEMKNNRFTIKTSAPNVKVSWQVTGVRSDPTLKIRPFIVEQEKPERERGSYLNPRAYGQPEERGAEWARNPEMMRQMKEQRGRVKRSGINR